MGKPLRMTVPEALEENPDHSAERVVSAAYCLQTEIEKESKSYRKRMSGTMIAAALITGGIVAATKFVFPPLGLEIEALSPWLLPGASAFGSALLLKTHLQIRLNIRKLQKKEFELIDPFIKSVYSKEKPAPAPQNAPKIAPPPPKPSVAPAPGIVARAMEMDPDIASPEEMTGAMQTLDWAMEHTKSRFLRHFLFYAKRSVVLLAAVGAGIAALKPDLLPLYLRVCASTCISSIPVGLFMTRVREDMADEKITKMSKKKDELEKAVNAARKISVPEFSLQLPAQKPHTKKTARAAFIKMIMHTDAKGRPDFPFERLQKIAPEVSRKGRHFIH